MIDFGKTSLRITLFTQKTRDRASEEYQAYNRRKAKKKMLGIEKKGGEKGKKQDLILTQEFVFF
jgi:hypothetical protein